MFEGFTNNNNQYYTGPLMQYAQVKQPSMNNPLTEEEIKTLNKNGGGWNTAISNEDLLRSVCTHKHNGKFTLRNNGDGTLTCTTCQETFQDLDLDPAYVKETTDAMKNILQIIKTCYIDIPANTAREFFPIIPLLEKVPKLAEIAVQNFAQYENGSTVQNGNTPSSFNALNAIMGTPATQFNYNANYAGFNGYQQPYQPMMQQQQPMMQQPMMQQQAMQQPMMQQPAQTNLQMAPTQSGFAPVNEFGSYGNMAQPVQQQYQPPIANQQPMQQQSNDNANPVVADTRTFKV